MNTPSFSVHSIKLGTVTRAILDSPYDESFISTTAEILAHYKPAILSATSKKVIDKRSTTFIIALLTKCVIRCVS